MLNVIKEQIEEFFFETLSSAYPDVKDWPKIELEIPADKKHGHFSCNVAMRMAKAFKQPPLATAERFKTTIIQTLTKSKVKDYIDQVEVKHPGFINIFLKPQSIVTVLKEIYENEKTYGSLTLGQGQKVCIEFVSANPTGPLSIAHARQAAVGDALGNVLKYIGYDVTKEYYVNDGGNQINILGLSIQLRSKEILGEKIEFPEDGYQGEYIKEMAQLFMDQNQIRTINDLNQVEVGKFKKFGVDYLMGVIEKDLEDFHVHFDVWSNESQIATRDKIEEMLAYLGEKGFLYEKEGALWFRSTDFGDDKDRVLQKSDGSYTYITPDIVYHKNKFDRGFNKIIDILGPDHHGYISRLKAAAEAMGKNRDDLEVMIVQLATIFRDGQAISMSTRRGQFISLREILDEVGADVARYFFLMRHIKAHLEFDLELAKKESSENPVYYIQYAYARINSIYKKAKEQSISAEKKNFDLLILEEELELVQNLGRFSDSLLFCHDQLDPYPLGNYLFELATSFHKFYDRHRVIEDNKKLSEQRLGLVMATQIVLAKGMSLLGISRPETM
ncbi:MAG: arginine--tRNA ligase [Candidatus Omnitrophica bacterium]|nr:arginine--tRNA ligase [Candidatus Omnitrophota bacterium]